MKLSKYLSSERVVDLEAADKAGALSELCGVIATSKNVRDAKAFRKALLAREAVLSTGIGLGLAVPHAKVASVRDFTMAVGRSKPGIEWQSLDGAPVRIIVMIAANEKQAAEYTKVLAAVVAKVKPEDVRRRVLEAAGPADVYAILSD
jgi:mannitol/fructose-specific phosphotransferase system IIA component (Ntr-type)